MSLPECHVKLINRIERGSLREFVREKPAGRFFFNVLASLARMERELTIEFAPASKSLICLAAKAGANSR